MTAVVFCCVDSLLTRHGRLKHLKKLAQDFGTENDTQELRDRMHEGRSKTSALAKETTNQLKAIAADKGRQDKLKRQLQTQLQDFEKMSQEHRRQEREMLVQMEEQFSATYNHAPQLGGSYEEDEEQDGATRGRTRTRLALELGDGMEDADVKVSLDVFIFFFLSLSLLIGHFRLSTSATEKCRSWTRSWAKWSIYFRRLTKWLRSRA